MTAVIYHCVDWDGWMSAAILRKAISEGNRFALSDEKNTDFIGYNHGSPVPDLSAYSEIWFLDVTFPIEEMKKLEKDQRIIFVIDHHKSFLDEITLNPLDTSFTHVTINTEYAACELTWRKLYPHKDIPMVVKLIGEYDMFNKSGRMLPWQDILSFQIWARQQKNGIETASSVLRMTKAQVMEAIDSGTKLIEFSNKQALEAWRFHSVDIVYGKEKGKLLFTTQMNSMTSDVFFQEMNPEQEYKFVLMANWCDKNDNFKVSVRVDEKIDFDGCALARAFGGGGHIKAAGFYLSKEQMISLLTAKNINK